MNEYSKFKLNLDKNDINVVVYDPSKEAASGKLSKVGAIHHIHVIDRSGSMYGTINELIDNVQKSFEHIEDDDYLTVIWFSSQNEFRTVIKAARKSDNIKLMLDKLRSTVGATCFSDPMKEVNAIIDELYSLCPNISVTLFTDGQPCVPWSTESEYKRVMDEVEKMKGKVLAINTVGYGNYYNQEFLKGISQATQFGMMTHSTKIEQYFDIFEENKASVSGMVNQKTEIVSKNNHGIMYVGPKTCKLETKSLVQRQRSKTKNLYFIIGDSNDGVSVNNTYMIGEQKFQATDDETIQDFVYAYAYQQYYLGNRKEALDLIVKGVGDKNLADAMINAFTFDEVAVCTSKLKDAAYETKYRNPGTCKKNYIPADDAICLMDFISDLSNEDASYLPFSKNVDSYKRVGRKTEDGFNLFEKNDGEVLSPWTELVYSSERLNLSTRFMVEGKVSLNPNDAKAAGLPSTIDSRIFRVHTLVKDGNLNMKQIEVSLPSKGNAAKKYCSMLTEVGKDRFVADLTKLPIINHSYVKQSTNIDNIFDKVVAINKLEAKQKVLNHYIDNTMEEGQSVLKKENEFKNYSVAQIEVLEKHGLDSKLNYAGVNRQTPSVGDSDFYEAREIKFVLKGVSSLPKVEDYLKKKKENKITTFSLRLMDEAHNWLDSLKLKLDKPSAELRDKLKANLAKVKAEMNLVRNELNTLKLAKILTGDWFKDLKTNEDGDFFYDKGDTMMIVKANRKKVYITPEA